MQELSKALDDFSKNAQTSHPQTLTVTDNRDAITVAVPLKKAANRLEVAAVVMHTESRKQIRVGQQERDVLIDELLSYGFTIDQLKLRAEGVVFAETYGTVALKYWLSESEVFAKEAERQAEIIIRNRREQFKSQNFNKTMLEVERLASEEGLQRVQNYWMAEMQNAIEKHFERFDKKCRRLKGQFHQLPQEAKDALWQKAVERGIVKDDDPFKHLVLPMLVPKMLLDFEDAIKNESVKERQ